MKTVLIVEPDDRFRNIARDTLMRERYLVFTAEDGFQAMQLLGQTPIKDAVFIAGDLTATLKDEWSSIIDVPEQTPLGIASVLRERRSTADIPIFITLPREIR